MRSLYAKSRDNARTPMQWNDKENAGFTEGKPWIKVNPNYKEIHAKRQLTEENSIFKCYQKLIRLRKEYSVFVDGKFRMLCKEDVSVFAYTRENEDFQLLVICNFYDKTICNPLEEPEPSAKLLISNYLKIDTNTVLRPYEARMYLKDFRKSLNS